MYFHLRKRSIDQWGSLSCNCSGGDIITIPSYKIFIPLEKTSINLIFDRPMEFLCDSRPKPQILRLKKQIFDFLKIFTGSVESDLLL
jgi:hypothetical protein